MDAGSSCFCLLCHPSAKACQFHYHASTTGHRPGLPKVKNYVFICAHVCVKPNITEAPPPCQTSKCPFALRRLPIDAKKLSCVHGHAESVYVFARPHRPTLSFTHTLTKMFVSTEPLLMMGGSMMFVCVPKELALPLGPNQQPTAAGY